MGIISVSNISIITHGKNQHKHEILFFHHNMECDCSKIGSNVQIDSNDGDDDGWDG